MPEGAAAVAEVAVAEVAAFAVAAFAVAVFAVAVFAGRWRRVGVGVGRLRRTGLLLQLSVGPSDLPLLLSSSRIPNPSRVATSAWRGKPLQGFR
jgi:hypothetical protein